MRLLTALLLLMLSIPMYGQSAFMFDDTNPWDTLASPLDISSLRYMWEADRNVYTSDSITLCADGDSISLWKDLSGNGQDVGSISGTGQRPTWCATCGPNSNPAIVCDDATNTRLMRPWDQADNWTEDKYTVVVVAKFASATENRNSYFVGREGGGVATSEPRQWRVTAGSASTYRIGGFSSSDGTSNLATQVQCTFSGMTKSTSWRYYTVRRNSGTPYFDGYLNGVAQSAAVSGSDPNILDDQKQITVAAYMTGWVTAIYVFDDALSAGEITTIHTYIEERWGPF